MIERLNCEIRRRTSVIGIFPNESSYVRLVTTYLMEYAEDWSVARAYISHESIAATLQEPFCELYLTRSKKPKREIYYTDLNLITPEMVLIEHGL